MKKNQYWSKLNKKQKIDYYFQYYFSWTLAAIAIVAFVSYYAYQLLTKVTPDIYVISVADNLPEVEQQDALVEYITENITDVDSDGEKFIEYNAIAYTDKDGASEQNYMYMQKYVTLLGEGNSRVLIMDKDHYEGALIDEQFEGFLVDLSDITDNHYKNFAVPVSETTLYDAEGLDFFDDYYVVLTQIGGDKKESGINLDRLNAGKQFIADILK